MDGLTSDLSQTIICSACIARERCAFSDLAQDFMTIAGSTTTLPFTLRSFEPNNVAVHQGEPIRQLLVLCVGTVVLTMTTEDGQEFGVQTIGAGGIIGLSDWLENAEMYSISAYTLTGVTVTAIKIMSIPPLLDAFPERNSHVFRQMGFQVSRSLHFQGMLPRLGSLDRVVMFILEIFHWAPSDKTKFILASAIRREVLAKMLGLRVETVSRAITVLRKKGAITIDTCHRVIYWRNKLTGIFRFCRKL